MQSRNLDSFINWLGLEPAKKYKIGNDGKVFTLDKHYNLYYDGDGVGISLTSLTLHQVLNIREVK